MSLTKKDLQEISGLLEPVNSRLDKMDGRLDKMEEDIRELQGGFAELQGSVEVIKKSVLYIENVKFPKIEVALEGAVAAMTKNREQDARLDLLETTVERHDYKIAALEHAISV